MGTNTAYSLFLIFSDILEEAGAELIYAVVFIL
jgi:hypothetical protein